MYRLAETKLLVAAPHRFGADLQADLGRTGGVVDARFIALVNTALESPLGQIAMIPMLAWIARSAPANLKATYGGKIAVLDRMAT